MTYKIHEIVKYKHEIKIIILLITLNAIYYVSSINIFSL